MKNRIFGTNVVRCQLRKIYQNSTCCCVELFCANVVSHFKTGWNSRLARIAIALPWENLEKLCLVCALRRWTSSFSFVNDWRKTNLNQRIIFKIINWPKNAFEIDIACAVICAILIQQRTASTKRVTCNFVQIVQLFTTKKLQSSPCSLWFIPMFQALFPRQECRVQLSVHLANKQCTVGELGRHN